MKRTILFIAALMLCINATNSQTLFAWETAYYDGDPSEGAAIVETKDGITVSVDDGEATAYNNDIRSEPDFFGSGSSGNYIAFAGVEVTFDFDQPVDVNSILVIDRSAHRNRTWDCIFIPIGGGNVPVSVRLDTFNTVNFNWIGVTSFKVIGANFDPSGELASFAFDDLLVSATSLGLDDARKPQKTTVYPNPVENILYLKNSVDLKSMELYSSLGQLVLQSNQDYMDVSHLSKGMYVLKIDTDRGTETKKIIKH